MTEKGHSKTAIDQYVVDRTKSMRLERKMSQAVLAAKLNVDNSFIGAVENPKARAKYNLIHINMLASIFDCSHKDFLPEKSL